jgi:hypothetical protein
MMTQKHNGWSVTNPGGRQRDSDDDEGRDRHKEAGWQK